MIIDTVAVFLAGILVGAALVRYGVGLGFKAFRQAKEDMPLSYKPEPAEQSYTNEFTPIEQENTNEFTEEIETGL